RTLTIKKATIIVTADEKSKAYGQEDPALTYKITEGALVGEDAFSGKMTRQNGETTGDYTIESGTLALSDSYDLTFHGAIFTITKAQATIIADAVQALTYDGTVKNVSATLNHPETALAYAPQQG